MEVTFKRKTKGAFEMHQPTRRNYPGKTIFDYKYFGMHFKVITTSPPTLIFETIPLRIASQSKFHVFEPGVKYVPAIPAYWAMPDVSRSVPQVHGAMHWWLPREEEAPLELLRLVVAHDEGVDAQPPRAEQRHAEGVPVRHGGHR